MLTCSMLCSCQRDKESSGLWFRVSGGQVDTCKHIKDHWKKLATKAGVSISRLERNRSWWSYPVICQKQAEVSMYWLMCLCWTVRRWYFTWSVMLESRTTKLGVQCQLKIILAGKQMWRQYKCLIDYTYDWNKMYKHSTFLLKGNTHDSAEAVRWLLWHSCRRISYNHCNGRWTEALLMGLTVSECLTEVCIQYC
jgi:hypothetical protein